MVKVSIGGSIGGYRGGISYSSPLPSDKKKGLPARGHMERPGHTPKKETSRDTRTPNRVRRGPPLSAEASPDSAETTDRDPTEIRSRLRTPNPGSGSGRASLPSRAPLTARRSPVARLARPHGPRSARSARHNLYPVTKLCRFHI